MIVRKYAQDVNITYVFKVSLVTEKRIAIINVFKIKFLLAAFQTMKRLSSFNTQGLRT